MAGNSFLFHPSSFQYLHQVFELLPREILRDPIRWHLLRGKVFQLEAPLAKRLTEPHVLNI